MAQDLKIRILHACFLGKMPSGKRKPGQQGPPSAKKTKALTQGEGSNAPIVPESGRCFVMIRDWM